MRSPYNGAEPSSGFKVVFTYQNESDETANRLFKTGM
jgi:hypothetical protein